ncbi:uncharacterized protein BDR25DRAFT_206036, partial [Lindgomyces ingoldianus]
LTLYSIILVHGLRGHPRETWEATPAASAEDTAKKPKGFMSLFKHRVVNPPSTSTGQAHVSLPPPSNVFWSEECLASDIPQARVWTYGYNTDVIGGLFQANNKNTISQHGRDSLGGIIIKDAINRSDKIREWTKLIIFLGTPHQGSAIAGWGQVASNLARVTLQDSNKKLLETLEVNSEVLDNIHEQFKAIVFKSGIKVHSFQEARGMIRLGEKVCFLLMLDTICRNLLI